MASVKVIVRQNTQKVSLKVSQDIADMTKAIYDTNNSGVIDNSEKVNNLTVEKAVPSNAKFTDTVYDDTALDNRVTVLESDVDDLQDEVQDLGTGKEDKKDYINKSSNYTTLSTDGIIDCTGSFELTLYTALGNKGNKLQLKNKGVGIVTILPTGLEELEGESTQELLSGESQEWLSDGSNWIII